MSMRDDSAKKRIADTNRKIRALQRGLTDHFAGRRVRITQPARGTHSRRRYKPGTEFIVHDIIAEGGEVFVWLSRCDEDPPKFELSVWLWDIEFLDNEVKS